MRCAVYGCSADNQAKGFSGDIKFFSFPKDKKMEGIWEHLCKRGDKFKVKSARICSNHFSDSDYKRNLKHEFLGYTPKKYRPLKEDAIPSKNLPLSRPQKLQENGASRREERIKIRGKKKLIETVIKGKMEETTLKETITMDTIEIKNEPLWTDSVNVLKIESEELQVSSDLINEDNVKKEVKQELDDEGTNFLHIDLPALKNDEEDITEDYCNEQFLLDADITEKNYLPSQSCIQNEKPHKCEICSKRFSFKSRLLLHSRVHTGENKCQICSKRFSKMALLVRHSKIHTGESPFKCQVCMKQFGQQNQLISHSRTHTGEKPYKCEICLKQFSLKNILTRHSKIHTGERPHKCEVCLKEFALKSNLLKHFRIHTNEKPFKCKICSKQFSDKWSFNRHSRIHTGEKPYECEVCLKPFSDKSSLNSHTRTHAGERRYKCEICLKHFSRRQRLIIHSIIHIGE